MFEATLTVAVLDENENLKLFLDPSFIEIEETNELYKLRTIKITHKLLDKNDNDLTKYDSVLIAGNKLWREETTDGDSCLYVIRGPKSYDFDTNTVTINAVEVACELGENQVFRSDNFSWIVDSTFISTYFGNQFDTGTLTGPGTVTPTEYSGALSSLAILNEIQNKTGGEFFFRYEYDSTNNRINRYIDYSTTIGKTHTTPIEIGYNAKGIELEIDETNVRIGCAPIGKPSNETDEFHVHRLAWENLAITKGSTIKLWYQTDSNGNLVEGPNATAPYTKLAGSNYIYTDVTGDLTASYRDIQYKDGTDGSTPRLFLTETIETNATNIYWDCVKAIRNHIQPEITINCSTIDLEKLSGESGTLYNVGDVIYVRIPGRTDTIQCRITRTTKNPRKPEEEQIEISTYRTSFMDTFYQGTFKSPGSINIS
jgi:hypothetical protein